MSVHISRAPVPNCVNPDSFGEICVGCGQCGRGDTEPNKYRGFAYQANIDPVAWHPWVQYGEGDDAPVYFAICPVCGKFVRADEFSGPPQYIKANATCKTHGRVKMPFACWASEMEET